MTKKELRDKRDAVIMSITIKLSTLLLSNNNKKRSGNVKAAKNEIILDSNDYYLIGTTISANVGYDVSLFFNTKAKAHIWNIH